MNKKKQWQITTRFYLFNQDLFTLLTFMIDFLQKCENSRLFTCNNQLLIIVELKSWPGEFSLLLISPPLFFFFLFSKSCFTIPCRYCVCRFCVPLMCSNSVHALCAAILCTLSSPPEPSTLTRTYENIDFLKIFEVRHSSVEADPPDAIWTPIGKL